MKNHSDLTFITNEQNQSLLEEFKVLIKDASSNYHIKIPLKDIEV